MFIAQLACYKALSQHCLNSYQLLNYLPPWISYFLLSVPHNVHVFSLLLSGKLTLKNCSYSHLAPFYSRVSTFLLIWLKKSMLEMLETSSPRCLGDIRYIILQLGTCVEVAVFISSSQFTITDLLFHFVLVFSAWVS